MRSQRLYMVCVLLVGTLAATAGCSETPPKLVEVKSAPVASSGGKTTAPPMERKTFVSHN